MAQNLQNSQKCDTITSCIRIKLLFHFLSLNVRIPSLCIFQKQRCISGSAVQNAISTNRFSNFYKIGCKTFLTLSSLKGTATLMYSMFIGKSSINHAF